MPNFKTLDDLPDDLTGQVALVRVDLNLPMQDGSASDVTRVEAAKPNRDVPREHGLRLRNTIAHY